MPPTQAILRRPRRPVAALPETIDPMLALLAPSLPSDPKNWSFEVKWDGVRAIAFWDSKRLRLISRNLLDITHRYPELQPLGPTLACRSAILDGEIVALDDAGAPSFPA